MVLSLAAMSTISACSTELEPFTPSSNLYTVLGYLDTDADTQFVRIVPLRAVVQRDTLDSLDVAVTTTNLESGEVAAWEHNLMKLTDSTYGHVYSAAFDVKPGDTLPVECRATGWQNYIRSNKRTRSPGESRLRVWGAQ